MNVSTKVASFSRYFLVSSFALIRRAPRRRRQQVVKIPERSASLRKCRRRRARLSTGLPSLRELPDGAVEDARRRPGAWRGRESGRVRAGSRWRPRARRRTMRSGSGRRYEIPQTLQRLRPDRRAHLVPVPRRGQRPHAARFSTSTAAAWPWATISSPSCSSTTRSPATRSPSPSSCCTPSTRRPSAARR